MSVDKSVIDRRNTRLVDFFKCNNIDVRLIGKPDCPAIIWNDSYVLSAYVHNFNLIFTDSPRNGSKVAEYKLRMDVNPSHEEIINIIHSSVQRPVYRIQHDSGLYLSGYNFLDKRDKDSMYPVFAKHNPKVYMSKESAETVVQMLSKSGYDTKLVSPNFKL